MVQKDPFIEEIRQRVGDKAHPGDFYVINPIVARGSPTRILGPLPLEEAIRKGNHYPGIIEDLPKSQRIDFAAYEYIEEGTFERYTLHELKLKRS